MVKAYLKYEQIAAFGVVASGTAACVEVFSEPDTPLVASANGDAVVVWNMRTGDSVVRLGNVQTRKAGPIHVLAASRGGETIAAGYADGSIRLWEFNLKSNNKSSAFNEEEPEPLLVFNGHRSAVSSISFEKIPESKLASKTASSLRPSALVSGSSDGDLILWNISDGTGRFRLPVHNDVVTSVIYFKSKGSSYIASSSKDGTVKIFDADTQYCMQTIVGHRGEVWAMALDPTNSLLITGSIDAEIRGYLFKDPDSETENVKRKEKDLLSFGYDNVFKAIGSIQRHTAAERVTSIGFTIAAGETYMITGAADKTAELFRMRGSLDADKHRKRREKRRVETIHKELSANAQDEGWDDSTLQQKLEERKADVSFQLEMPDFFHSIRQMRLSKKLRSISFLSADLRNSKSQSTGIELRFINQYRETTIEIQKYVISNKRKSKKRKNSAEDQSANSALNDIQKLVTLEFPGHRSDIRSISLAPDDNTLLSTCDGALKIWNVATQKCVRSMKFDAYGISSQFLGVDGRIAAVGTKSGLLRIYDVRSGTLIAEEPDAHKGEIWSMCLDDQPYESDILVTGGSDKKVCMWEISDILTNNAGKLKQKHVLEMPDEVLCVKVAIGRDRPVLLVSLMDATVRSFFMDTFEPYLSFYGHRLPVMCLDVSSDGLILATGSADKSVKLWGMDFGDCRRSLRAHSESVLCIAFQPNTHYLFSGSRDGTVKYWDADKFEYICEFEGQKGEAWSLVTSADGEFVVTGSRDRLIRAWRRTDEPLFLEEEQDRRMDEMFESTLIEEDLKEASKSKKNDVGFMKDLSKGEASAAGKRSLETVKGGERLLEALKLCAEEEERVETASDEAQNPMMLGLSVNLYILKTLTQIKTADLDEALHILPLDAAMELLGYCSQLLDEDCKHSRVWVEMLVRSCLYLIKLHHSQITAGAASRKLISDLNERMTTQIDALRKRMGFNSAALQFWQDELAERDDAPFRDAEARAHNIARKKFKSGRLQAVT